MTKEEILEYNRRCAVFLGCTFEISSLFENNEDRETVFFEKFSKPSWWDDSANRRYGFLSYQQTGYMLYHSDWNWIMEVIDAIEKIDINRFAKQLDREDVVPIDGKFYLSNFDTEAVFLASVYYWQHDNLIEGLNEIKAETKKEAVVQAINQFLIWYENNK